MLLIVGLLAGCTSPLAVDLPSASTTPTATAVNAPAATPTPSPSPTATTMPTPTPTPQPAELLSRAERAYRLGDWETAAAAYEQLLPLSFIPQDDAFRAAMGFGKTLIAQGRIGEGAAWLRDLAATLPQEDPRSPELQLFLADALVAAGEPLAAAPHYQRALTEAPLLAPYAYQWLGDALFAGGVYTDALAAYDAALGLAAALDRQVFLQEKRALTFSTLQSYPDAMATYDAILAVARIPAYRARILFQAAETARLFGDIPEARQRYLALIAAYPEEAASAHPALIWLVENNVPVDDLLRGKINYYAKSYTAAVQALGRHVLANAAHTGEPHHFAGLAYLDAGSPALALNEFQILLDTHPGDAYWGSAWIGKARALAALGRNAEAIAAYRALPQALPDHPRAVEALRSAAQLLERTGERADAAAAYLDLATRYPNDSGAPNARFRAGLLRYQLADLTGAQAAWEELARWYPADARAQAARFWLGKTHLQAGNLITGTAYLSETVTTSPWSYYGLRAADLLAARPPLTVPAGPLRPCGDAVEQDAVFAWLAEWLGAASPAELRIPPQALLADPRLERGALLLRAERFDEGRTELEALRTAYRSDALAQYHLALIFRDLGLYRSSIIAAATVLQLAPAGDLTQAPRFLGCLIYPTYFSELVEPNAADFGLPLLPTYALLRQESLFEGFATSWAAARGLMQVIPSTGAYIAESLGWPPGYETRDLYRPMVSVRFGTWYLAEQVERFGGELYPALAGYNGGPGNAARWWNAAGQDHDLFVELIAFEETRTYVERITQHTAWYRWLYAP